MKTLLKKISVASLCLVMVASMAMSTPANEKLIAKARAAVENAEPNDWKTLAKSAKACIKKNVNMQEALQWLEKSVSIDKNPTNLELLGDYYLKLDNKRKAIGYYVEGMKVGKSKNFNFDTSRLETKIGKATKKK